MTTTPRETAGRPAGGWMPVIFAAHGAPVLAAAGVAAGQQPRVSFPITGFWMEGAFTKRSVQLG